MTILDLNFVRSQFPAFDEPSLQGWAFFQNAGGSYACAQVIGKLTRYYRETKLQPYGYSPASVRAGEEMDEAYTRLAAYLNVGEDELHFGPSTSQNTYVLANAFRSGWQVGDEVIVTNQDHEANSGVWRNLAETGIIVREWRIDRETGQLDLADLDDLLNEKTRLVAFPHCSNVIAHENPVADITAKAHAAGALVVVDGVAYAPHGLPDVGALDADIYLFSTYKTFGPHQGIMTVRRPLLDRLSNQGHYFNAENIRKKLLPAGPDHAQIAAVAGIADYFDRVYDHHFEHETVAAERGRRLHSLFREYEKKLLAPLLAWLRDRDGVRIVGPDDAAVRAPTVSVTLHDQSTAAVASQLADHKVMAGAGHFYGARPLEGMGIPLDPGVLRLSFVHYTSEEEIDQLIWALDAVLP
jgi:cysteine desulfurase family protein (TIGR01976 family)